MTRTGRQAVAALLVALAAASPAPPCPHRRWVHDAGASRCAACGQPYPGTLLAEVLGGRG